MSDYSLQVPEEVFQRAQHIAQMTSQPVETILLEHLRLMTEQIPILDPSEEAELQALRYLSDDALWTIAREQMPQINQQQLQTLMDKNSAGTLADDEQMQLEALVERGNRLMLRKSEAAAILTERGHSINKADLTPRE